MRERCSQVESEWKFEAALLARRIDLAGRVAVILEAGEPPRLGFIRIDRFCFIIATARMGAVINAAAERAAIPAVNDVEGQRGVDRNGRMQTGGRRPGLEADAANRLTRAARRGHR